MPSSRVDRRFRTLWTFLDFSNRPWHARFQQHRWVGLKLKSKTDFVFRLTFGVNQCRQSFEISCIQSDYCTVGYLNSEHLKEVFIFNQFLDGFKGIVKAKGLRFGINGDLISAEVIKYDNQGIQNIYQCRTSVNMLSSDKLRYEVRVYLNKAFVGHNIELVSFWF